MGEAGLRIESDIIPPFVKPGYMERIDHMQENDRSAANMRQSHRLFLYAMITIAVLALISALLVYLSGKGTGNLTAVIILKVFMGFSLIIGITIYLLKKYPNRTWARYMAIFMLGLCILLNDFSLSGNKEAFGNFYLMMLLSLLYFDMRLSIFSSIVVLILHSVLVLMAPQIMPSDNLGVILAERYINFILFGIGAGIVASFLAKHLQSSLEKEEQARTLSGNLQKVAVGVAAQANLLAISSTKLLASATDTGMAAEQVKSGVEDLAEAAGEGARNAQNTAEVVRQMSFALGTAGNNIQVVSNQSLQFGQIVDNGLSAMKEQSRMMLKSNQAHASVSEAVYLLNDKSKQIEEIVGLIGEIANQTNLLALNAAIEAARAGDAGRGFAVVADEVRKLAEQSGQAVQNIDHLIRDIQQGVSTTATEIERTNEINTEQDEGVKKTQVMFDHIEQGAQRINMAIEEVSAVIQEMLSSTEEMVQNVENISAYSQESAASTEEITALSEQQASSVHIIVDMARELAVSAQELQSLVQGFTND